MTFTFLSLDKLGALHDKDLVLDILREVENSINVILNRFFCN